MRSACLSKELYGNLPQQFRIDVFNCAIDIEILNTPWFKKINSISYIYISWTIQDMWIIYNTFERGGPVFVNNIARALHFSVSPMYHEL